MKGGASCDPPPPLTCALGVSLIPSPSSTHTESRLQTHRPRESHIPLFAESKSLRSKLLHQPFRTPPPYPPFITDKPDENDYWNSSRYRWFILSSNVIVFQSSTKRTRQLQPCCLGTHLLIISPRLTDVRSETMSMTSWQSQGRVELQSVRSTHLESM